MGKSDFCSRGCMGVKSVVTERLFRNADLRNRLLRV